MVCRGAAGVEHVEEAAELDLGELVGARDGSSHAGVRVGAAEGVEEALAGLPRLLGRDDGNGREVDGGFGSPVALDGARLRVLRRPGRAVCSGGGVRGHGMRAAELHALELFARRGMERTRLVLRNSKLTRGARACVCREGDGQRRSRW